MTGWRRKMAIKESKDIGLKWNTFALLYSSSRSTDLLRLLRSVARETRVAVSLPLQIKSFQFLRISLLSSAKKNDTAEESREFWKWRLHLLQRPRVAPRMLLHFYNRSSRLSRWCRSERKSSRKSGKIVSPS